jgi:hypothetical protein
MGGNVTFCEACMKLRHSECKQPCDCPHAYPLSTANAEIPIGPIPSTDIRNDHYWESAFTWMRGCGVDTATVQGQMLVARLADHFRQAAPHVAAQVSRHDEIKKLAESMRIAFERREFVDFGLNGSQGRVNGFLRIELVLVDWYALAETILDREASSTASAALARPEPRTTGEK